MRTPNLRKYTQTSVTYMRKTLPYMETHAYTKNPNLHDKPYVNAKPAPIRKTLPCMKNPHLQEKP